MIYSKKLMDHLASPHNMGEIKDADGVGTVGNPTCVVPWTELHANDHLVRISEMGVGQRVLSHTGRYADVASKSRRKYSGELIFLKNRLGVSAFTPEHLVFAIRLPPQKRFLRTKHKRALVSQAEWVHGAELKKGDILLYPVLKGEHDLRYLDLGLERTKYDFRSKEIPSRIPLDGAFLRLVGYYLAEGHARTKMCKSCISFTFNIKEDDYAADVCSLVKSVFGLDSTIQRRPEHRSQVVIVNSAMLSRAFKTLFGGLAENKRIPHELMLLPLVKQVDLIKGLWRGDGHISVNRRLPRAGYSTVSYELCQQLKTLLLRQGIIPSVYIEGEHDRDGVHHMESYRLHVGDRQSVQKLAGLLGVDVQFVERSQIKSWVDADYLYMPVTGVTKTRYSGDVQNIEVADAHSFVSDSLCFHNCGDLMTMYIKVKADKIADIKFKTYGCGAAIGTSSVLTDMAKGKTIKEARSITKQQVADELGGLPAIKLHCSLLATEALDKAIADYETKRAKDKGL